MLGWLNLETHLGPEDEDHGDGGAELGAGKGEEVLHVGAAVGQDQHTEGRGEVIVSSNVTIRAGNKDSRSIHREDPPSGAFYVIVKLYTSRSFV